MGFVGLIAGVGAWLRTEPLSTAAEPVYSEQQTADAKKAVCEAFDKGMRSIRAVASKKAETPADLLPVAVNDRVGLVAVSTYFLNTLELNPAVPPQLDDLLRDLAKEYEDVALIQLADGAPSDYKNNSDRIDESIAEIDGICQ